MIHIKQSLLISILVTKVNISFLLVAEIAQKFRAGFVHKPNFLPLMFVFYSHNSKKLFRVLLSSGIFWKSLDNKRLTLVLHAFDLK